MNLGARGRLIAEIDAHTSGQAEIAVPLDLFFEGNDDPGSIGCNLCGPRPSIGEFYKALSAFRSRPEVQDVLVRISSADDEAYRPCSDTVCVISSIAEEEIASALNMLRFDDLVAGWMYGRPKSAPDPKPGFIPYSLGWD